MRVVLATNSRDRGSTSRTLEAWTRLLPHEGIDPVVTVGGPGPLLSALRDAEVPVRVRPLRKVPSKAWPWPFLLASLRLAATARRAGAALIHVNEHDHHPVAAQAARMAGLPLATHLRFKPTADYCRWLFRPGRIPDRVFFTSHTQMRDSAAAVEAFVPKVRWRVLPNGLDFSVFGKLAAERQRLRAAWNIGSDTVAVGIACAISPRKRVDHFVRAIARLKNAGVPVQGFIAGQAHFPEDRAVVDALKEQAAAAGIAGDVRFLGYVEPAEPLYHAWDLCLSTSQYETFGMTVLEAMGCACPVITYPGGSVAEIVGDAAVVVPDGDEDALFSQCLQLARDPDARKVLGECGRRHAESTYDIRRIVPMLAEEYRQIARGAGRDQRHSLRRGR
jgi:glycosyltransferase involved in cell wall biosynthesis